MKLGGLRDSFDFFHNSRSNLLTVALIALAAYLCANLFTLYYVGLVVLPTRISS